jgi:ectoine hydroxylase-related dioxygenase (phytanoyl-CoA dioxygenase family)
MTDFIAQIETNGYCVMPDVFSAEEVKRALELVKAWETKTADSLAANVPYLNQNQAVVYNLQNKDIYFLQLLFGSADVHYTLRHFLNDRWYKPIPADDPNYILRGFVSRSSQDSMPLHIDSMVPYQGAHVISMQASIILEDQDEENGCTLVVPGSHQSGEYVTQEAMQNAIPLRSQAGDVVLWDSRLWHGALANHSTRTRWALIATFARWWLKQSFNITDGLPTEIFNALTDSQKAMLGYCSVPFLNESEGIDMKLGYEALHRQSVSASQN